MIIKWLRKPRFTTANKQKAEKSIFQWGLYDDKVHYTLSILGIINGPLPKLFGVYLVVLIPENKLEFRRKKLL